MSDCATGDRASIPHHRTGYARSGDIALFYRAFGAPGCTPVLIAHGMSYFSYDWIDIAARIGVGREVVAFDQRGFGESSWSPDRDYSIEAFAGDMLALLDHLGWKRAVLMGHSMGGRNATFVAGAHPDRVEALILVDWSPETAAAGSERVRRTAGGLPDAFTSVDEAMRYFGKDPHSPEGDRLRERFEAYLRPVEGGFAIKRDVFFRDRSRAAMKANRSPGLVTDRRKVDMWDRFTRVRCPILTVRGNASDMFPASAVPKIEAANPNARVVEVAAGHDVAGQNPDALLSAIAPFLALH